MKFAILSDIHANLEALQNVLRDIEQQGVEKIHFLGDVVGYGCNPNKCIKMVNEHCEIKLLGNHDYAAMGLESTSSFNQMAQTSMEWTIEKLKKKSLAILADFEMEAVYLDYNLVHASPGHPEEWNYILNRDQAAEEFDMFDESVCFLGHSHLPVIFIQDADGVISQSSSKKLQINDDNRYIINVGSVGQPRDNDPRSCYVIVDHENRQIEYRRVEYDIGKVQEKMRKAMLPDFLIERIAVGR